MQTARNSREMTEKSSTGRRGFDSKTYRLEIHKTPETLDRRREKAGAC